MRARGRMADGRARRVERRVVAAVIVAVVVVVGRVVDLRS